jgi:hypothetical protein
MWANERSGAAFLIGATSGASVISVRCLGLII